MSTFIPYKNIEDLHKAYFLGQTNPTTYINDLIDNILELDVNTESIVRIYKDEANKQLETLATFANKEDLELYGVPFLIKDNIMYEGFEVTAQSKILSGYRAVYTAKVVKRLTQKGAICIGQTNMDEFAFGSSTEQSGFGQVTKNQIDNTKVAGGTSGGSAVAIGLGLVPFALGTDTGGSIRQPASFTGVYGFRPTYGSVPRVGAIASASSFDQIGPFASSLDDLALVYNILRGVSTEDQTSIDIKDNYTNIDDDKLSVAIVPEFLQGLNPEVSKFFTDLIIKLKRDPKIIVKEQNLPLTPYILPVYYILQTVEASSNLERFDQIRFAKSVEVLEKAHLFNNPREQLLGDETKRRIMLGTYTSSAGYFDAYYNQACKVRSLIQKEYQLLFDNSDILIMPASPFEAFDIGGKTHNPIAMYTADIMTVSQPIARLPGLVIPFGKSSGMPVGLQIVSKEGSDLKLLLNAKIITEILQDL
jgi:aspartyl-tRNA(Asn)/glutamyl-tRNA(Gln) amidotransferase subunit A